MRFLFLLVLVLGLGGQLAAQVRVPISKPRPIERGRGSKEATTVTVDKVKLPRVSVDDLIKMLDWTDLRIDTTLKKKGYLLMQKDVDSTSSLFQYSHVSRETDAAATVRSIVLMDAAVGGIKGRMITYRTYDKEEYRDISSYLLENGYSKTNSFDFGESKHSLYNNGRQEIRIKVTTTVKDKRTFVSYELELGK